MNPSSLTDKTWAGTPVRGLPSAPTSDQDVGHTEESELVMSSSGLAVLTTKSGFLATSSRL